MSFSAPEAFWVPSVLGGGNGKQREMKEAKSRRQWVTLMALRPKGAN